VVAGRFLLLDRRMLCLTPRMSLRFAVFSLVMLLLPVHSASAGGNPKNKGSITFHLETEANDNPKMIFPQEVSGQTRYFRRVPEINLKDFVSYTPFPSETGEGFGLVLRLKEPASRRLSAITNINQQRWLIANVNGRIIDGVLIDKQIDDGVLVVWKGANLEDVALIDKALPRTGEEGKKRR
jgi:hypothetical protein